MTETEKRRCRELIDKENYYRLGQIDDDPSPLDWGHKCSILYEDMDGNARECHAILNHDVFRGWYFVAINGPAKGNMMCGVFGYKRLMEENINENA